MGIKQSAKINLAIRRKRIGTLAAPDSTFILLTLLSILVINCTSCTSDLKPSPSRINQRTSFNRELEAAAALSAVKVDFHFSNFFTPSQPHPATQCAGDVKTYYSAFDLNGKEPSSLPQSNLEPSISLKPLYLKNVSVDLTDSSTNTPSNQSTTCAFREDQSSFQASTCSSFDIGAIGGIPSTLGGSVVSLGGVISHNFAAFPGGFSLNCGKTSHFGSPHNSNVLGTTQCANLITALGIDVLPGRVSSWINLSSVLNNFLPHPFAGASLTFSEGAKTLYLFGGATQLNLPNEVLFSADGAQTFSLHLQEQKWIARDSVPLVHNSILFMPDRPNVSTTTQFLSKSIGHRALFGYAAVPAMALNGFSKNGRVTSALIDSTERIVVSAGLTSENISAGSTYKFNPTFGPEWVDTLGQAGTEIQERTPVQWLDSHHTQLLNNLNQASLFRNVSQEQRGTLFSGFGFAPLRKVDAQGTVTAGLFATVGGFAQTPGNSSEVPGQILEPRFGGKFFYGGFKKPTNLQAAPELLTSNFNRTPGVSSRIFEANFPQSTRLTEMAWIRLVDADSPTPLNTVPHFTAVNLLPGFSLKHNDLVYFGGTTCPDFLDDVRLLSSSPDACFFSNPGRYWRLASDAGLLNSVQAPLPAHRFPTNNWNGTLPPQRAGMASARGEDASGKTIIVAWGGMNKPLTSDDLQIHKIFILYNQNGSNNLDALTPKWVSINPGGSVLPRPSTFAAMTYSHITRKFYVFGGARTTSITGQNETHSDTWELSVNGSCPSCQFFWKKLNSGPEGITCYPNCPLARRAHRMTEVNYHYFFHPEQHAGTYNPSTLEPQCTHPEHPCSFGIFMEGGVNSQGAPLNDRWMFDPTANGGRGHWQLVDGFPPRHFATLSTAEFKNPAQDISFRWLVLFGGETALQNPLLAAPAPVEGGSQQFFIPPTLGDTFLYNTENNAWNRAELLGRGFKNDLPDNLKNSDFTQAFIVKPEGHFQKIKTRNGSVLQFAPEIAELSPPPLSGAIAVTRTHARKNSDPDAPPTLLPVQEVYLLGGRLKSGHFNTLDHVYKFCPGSGGEKPAEPRSASEEDLLDHAECEPLDASFFMNNRNSIELFPGRWLRKTPKEVPQPLRPTNQNFTAYLVQAENLKSFLGAGTYDSHRDKIILFGGLGAESQTQAITELNQETGSTIYEYTPPSKMFVPTDSIHTYKRHGFWMKVPPCQEQADQQLPRGRYGHSMHYDPLHQQLVILGGFDRNRNPLTQNITSETGRTITAPEIWTAKRVDSEMPCYHWTQKTSLNTDSNYDTHNLPAGGLSHAATAFIPSGGYNSGYYSLFDHSCLKAGTQASDEFEENKKFAGGVYFDIDREQLGPNENLLLHLTLMPLGTSQLKPDGTHFKENETTLFRVHLIHTGQDADSIRQTLQPRHISYNASALFPVIVQSLAVISNSGGGLQQEQIYLPISMHPGIDRIRIERESGSGILIDATILRMGR